MNLAAVKLIAQVSRQRFTGLRTVVLGQRFPGIGLRRLHIRRQQRPGRSPLHRAAWLLTLYPKVYPLEQRLYNHGVPLAGAAWLLTL